MVYVVSFKQSVLQIAFVFFLLQMICWRVLFSFFVKTVLTILTLRLFYVFFIIIIQTFIYSNIQSLLISIIIYFIQI